MEAVFHSRVVVERGNPQGHIAVAVLAAERRRGRQLPLQSTHHQARIVAGIDLVEKEPRLASVGYEISRKAQRERCVRDSQREEEGLEPFSHPGQEKYE